MTGQPPLQIRVTVGHVFCLAKFRDGNDKMTARSAAGARSAALYLAQKKFERFASDIQLREIKLPAPERNVRIFTAFVK